MKSKQATETVAYRFLTIADSDSLYHCFVAAFSDYEVDMRMSQDQFTQRMVRDGVQLELSVGAFSANEMIGFCINGVGPWQGHNTVYDAGTGVVPQHRGRGVGKEMFDFMAPPLREAGFYQYLLEVIDSNLPALSLYRKLGFHETRKLAVFRSEVPVETASESIGVELGDVQKPDWRFYQSFWDGNPSWQNSIESIERIVKGKCVVGARLNDEYIGYGIVSELSGNVLQLAVARGYRRGGVGTAILAALQNKVSSGEPLKVNNIDFDLEGSLAFYQASGFKLALSQYEMIKTI